ncbi:MAG: NAD(P)H-hydrate epimerase, partial [Candidatus Brocadiaceae bacterium]
YGIPGIVLMENAGRACADVATAMLGEPEGRSVVVLCGKGHNGGDGSVVARHLTNHGADVRILLLASRDEVLQRADESATNLRIALNMEISVQELQNADRVRGARRDLPGADLVVDALLGTGVSGAVREPFRTAIELINGCDRPVLAVDIPSGLDCDTGEPLGIAVRADRTVTFAASKVGLTRPGARAFTGEVQVAEISIPRTVIEQKTAEWQSEGT